MTSSANDEWDYDKLQTGLAQLAWAHRIILPGALAGKLQQEALKHTMDFIEYNMRKLEITGGNGD